MDPGISSGKNGYKRHRRVHDKRRQQTNGMNWKKDFEKNNREFSPRPLWFWNGELSEAEVRNQIRSMQADGYAGFGIVPAYGMSTPRPASPSTHALRGRDLFMSPEFLDAYEAAVDEAARLDLKVCLYDEFWFPSGWAGGQLAQVYPQSLSKRLDLHAIELAGPTRYQKLIPPGQLMAGVAMNLDSLERIDLSPFIRDNWLSWSVPDGQWRVMFFVCVTDGAKGLVDYLDPKAVDNYLELTYDRFFDRLERYFSSTIDSAFYDEPTFHWVEGGRAWTGDFNEHFVARFGTNPSTLYPALWFDIGLQTESARAAFFGLRTELLSNAYIKRMNDWCRKRGIQLTGHFDQEEVANPVGLCGDLMKVFEHQDIPAFDQVFQYGRSRRIAKVVSSAAANFGHRLTLCECYGATANLGSDDAHLLFAEAIDLFARGMNVLVPHAVWLEPSAMEFPPNLTSGDSELGPFVAPFADWVTRIQSVVQRGYTVADIAILYPIESMMASYRFGTGANPYLGGLPGKEMESDEDYLIIGDILSTELQRDFLYLHPDILEAKCSIASDEQGVPVLELGSSDNGFRHQFRAVILPSMKNISLTTLVRLKQFHDAGGVLISTGCQPVRAVAPLGEDANAAKSNGEVARIMNSLFGSEGFASFILTTDTNSLRAVLEDRIGAGDVRIKSNPPATFEPGSGHLSCLHKRLDDTDVYFVGNSRRVSQTLSVDVRGHHRLEKWDPKTGAIHAVETTTVSAGDGERTGFTTTLGPAECALFVTVSG